MFRRLRRHLRRIRYYSAKPTRSRWAAAIDLALFVSFALAIAAAWLCDALIIRTTLQWHQHGRLWRDDQHTIHAMLIDDHQINDSWGQSRPYGTFTLRKFQRQTGFPLASSHRPLPLEVQLDLFTATQAEVDTALKPDAPVHQAIKHALQKRPSHLSVAWIDANIPATRYWRALIMNSLIWWVTLYVAMAMIILLLRAGHEVLKQHRGARQRQMVRKGRCPSCGYDLRGLEFAERCPECGNLA